MNNSPIGVYDSGFGGLSVWRELRRLLPHESLLYLGDGKNCPYGGRSRAEIEGFAIEAVERLVEEGVKMEKLESVKNTLREAKLYRIYYDTTPRILPPAGDSADTDKVTVVQDDVPFMLVDDRNIMTIVLQKNNKVKLTMGGESFEVGADDNKVRWAIKTFVKNAKESPPLPSKRTTVITLPSGGKSLEYESSNGMITIKADAEADAKEFSSLNAAIYAAYGELREEAANELFGRSLSELTPEEQDAIHKAIPIRVSETSTAKHLSK